MYVYIYIQVKEDGEEEEEPERGQEHEARVLERRAPALGCGVQG